MTHRYDGSFSHSISRIEDQELRPEYRRSRPRRKLPALPRAVSASISNQLGSRNPDLVQNPPRAHSVIGHNSNHKASNFRHFKGRLEVIQRTSMDSDVEYPLNESDELNSNENLSLESIQRKIFHSQPRIGPSLAEIRTQGFENNRSPGEGACLKGKQNFVLSVSLKRDRYF